ncbi:mitochondrial NADH-ubiquinone oxidoreductase subunit [Drechslerella stenobrocha 248]|uniref:Mitochondrial NADH-ubiquinone oxidoreductase subunit n=1 Tax=Drechslerella stenobrocha 248 TaxID=1043628 RepID=W7HND6_9PEZI|nr:mitochondrial NADH-ubiquinone oxidoreductase subunit [Drechslerella stenobrocha 248]
MWKRHLKVTGDLGRITFTEFDLRNTESIEESVRHSDIVINLIGRDYETKNFNFWDVHVEGTQRIAEAVAKYDVDRYIHVSTHNADPESPSAFYRTKAIGESEARSIFPETTIVRPAPMWGEEDRLLNMHAKKHTLITSNNLQEKFYPVHVMDVGKALEVITYDDSTAGQTFELYGPRQYTQGQIRELIKKETLQSLSHINIPQPLHKLYRSAWEWVYWPQKSADEVIREHIDQVIDPTAKTFVDLGIDKTDDLAHGMIAYVRQYRSNKYYDLPPMTEKEKQEERKYWHVQDDYVKQ